MNGRITLARPYSPMREGEQYRPSLVGYAKRAYERARVLISEDAAGKIYDNPVTKYQHHLYLNLWLIELDFEWITEVK